MATITLGGNPIHTNGALPEVGTKAPNFELIKTDLGKVTLAEFSGSKLVLNIFPSIDTGTCATSVRTFNADASKLENTKVLCISRDLPFAQKRFCGSEGLENVINLSDFNTGSFGKAYGLEITDGPLAGLHSRVVIVLDENGTQKGATKILMGVSGRVIVKVVDKLSPPKKEKPIVQNQLFVSTKKQSWFSQLFPFSFLSLSTMPVVSRLDGYFFYSAKDATQSLIRLSDGSSQPLSGTWNFFETAPDQLFVFPSDEATKSEYKNKFYLIEHAGMTPLDAMALPNKIDSVIENHSQTYALFTGKRPDSNKLFVCLSELNIASGPACVFLDTLVGSPIVSVNFSDEHTVSLSTEKESFVYDAWLKTLATESAQRAPTKGAPTTESELIAAQTVLSLPKIKTFLGFTIENGKFVFWGFGTEVRKLSAVNYLVAKTVEKSGGAGSGSAGKTELFLVNSSAWTKVLLVTLNEMDQLWWLKNGTFITSP